MDEQPPPASGDEHQCHRIALQRCSRLLLNRQQGLQDDQKLWDEALGALQLCEDLWPSADFEPNRSSWAQFPQQFATSSPRQRRRRRRSASSSSLTATPVFHADHHRRVPAPFLPSELISRILFHLEGGKHQPAHEDVHTGTALVQRDLHAACLVNKHWHQTALQRLWRNPRLFSPVTLFQLQYCWRLNHIRVASHEDESRGDAGAGAAARRLDTLRFPMSEPRHTPLLRVIPAAFPNLTTLRLYIAPFTPPTLNKLLTGCRNLQLLTLRGECEPIDRTASADQRNDQWRQEEGLEQAREGLARLTALCLNTVVLVDSSKGFYSLVIHSIGDKLRHLNLGRTYCDDEIVVAVARLCPNLHTIILEENSLVSDTAISELARLCHKLRFVKLRNAIRVGDEAISVLVKNCAELQFLGISYTRCGDDTLYAITQYADKLHTLYLNDLGVTETALCELLRKRGSQFDTLGMASLDVISDRVICEITQYCCNLRRLDLFGCEGNLTEDLVDMLVSRLSRLEALVVAGIDEISDEYIERLAEKVSVEQFWLAPPPELT
ncbi:hypothetical protein HDU89_004642 [Geranomyces variabilis]|nr:hypothetical protein HDU89_004642 [Geranomyces variabilis]